MFGFTLAEVLITIGVIGLVAALTLPALISKHQDKVIEVQIKKAETVLANGFKMFMALEDNYSLDTSKLASCVDNKDCARRELSKVFSILLEPNEEMTNVPAEYIFTDTNAPIWNEDGDILYSWISPDGMIFGLKNFTETPSAFLIVSDVNGGKNPNQGGRDLCLFAIQKNGTLIESCGAMSSYNLSSDDEDGGFSSICGENCDNCDVKNNKCKKCKKGWYPDGISCTPCTAIPNCIRCNQVNGQCLEYSSKPNQSNGNKDKDKNNNNKN